MLWAQSTLEVLTEKQKYHQPLHIHSLTIFPEVSLRSHASRRHNTHPVHYLRRSSLDSTVLGHSNPGEWIRVSKDDTCFFSLVFIRTRAPNLEYLSVFCCVLHLVTNAKVTKCITWKDHMKCQWSFLTCQINFNSFSSAPVRSYSREANTKPIVHTKWGWEHPFCNDKQSHLQEVTAGNCWLHLLFINMKLKVTMYFKKC